MFERRWMTTLSALLVGVVVGLAIAPLANIGAATVVPTSTGPGGSALNRRVGVASIAINSTIGSCDILDLHSYGGGAIKIPASVTALAFYGSDDGTTFAQIYDNAATSAAAAPSVTAGTWVPFPDACFAFPYIKVVSTGANGTAKVVVKS